MTAREQDIFHWVVTGKLNKQIALKLGISEKTAQFHRTHG
ncbi:MAG: helix-turn-helix transcriptional regulator [Phycisphaeraceae bacterium]|nr:helix-turn-helix transcriptional regulator [Phycisphaeraceae bacterium]